MDSKRFIVTVVDDSIANLQVAKNALAESYDVFTAPSAAKMFDSLSRYKPNLILLDILMPDMDGYEAIKILKSNPDTRDIPVIFISGVDSIESIIEGLSLGAVDHISKPFIPQLLHKRVELHLTVEAQGLRLKALEEKLKHL